MLDSKVYGQIVVEMKVSIRSNTLEVLDDLNRILQTNEEKMLYFSDRPDRYLMCMYNGTSLLNRRYHGSTTTLTFTSSNHYWSAMVGTKELDLNTEGKFLLNNHGSAPTIPEMEFQFVSEAGFLAVVAPNGIIMLGNKEELDRIDLPAKETLMNEEMDLASMTNDGEKDWKPITSNNYDTLITLPGGATERLIGSWIPDYNKLNIGSGTKHHDQWGMRIKKSTNPKAGSYWNTYGYSRFINDGVDPTTNSIDKNWRMESRLTFFDASGKLTNTGMYLIVVFDEKRRPIMTTSVYNIDANTNEVTMTAKINAQDGVSKSSKIIHTAKFPGGFNGLIRMQTNENGYLDWTWNSERDQTSFFEVNKPEKFSNGNIVYIKNTAKQGWHHDGTAYDIAGFTRGRPNVITGVRTFQGKKQYEISYAGVKIYWMNEEDITKDKNGVGLTTTQQKVEGKKTVNHRAYHPKIAKMKAREVVVIGGTWDKGEAFSNASLNSIVLWKINGENSWAEINNTFQPGDLLKINNKSGEILLNGLPFDGAFEPDSRFFDVDYGPNEIQVITSPWATMPRGKLRFEERYR